MGHTSMRRVFVLAATLLTRIRTAPNITRKKQMRAQIIIAAVAMTQPWQYVLPGKVHRPMVFSLEAVRYSKRDQLGSAIATAEMTVPNRPRAADKAGNSMAQDLVLVGHHRQCVTFPSHSVTFPFHYTIFLLHLHSHHTPSQPDSPHKRSITIPGNPITL